MGHNVSGNETVVNHSHVNRGSMHVVWHQVIYSPEKIQLSHIGLRYLNNVQLRYMSICSKIYNTHALLAADSVVSRLEQIGSILHSCSFIIAGSLLLAALQ